MNFYEKKTIEIRFCKNIIVCIECILKILFRPRYFSAFLAQWQKWQGLPAVFPLTDQSSANAFSDRLRSTLGEEESTTRHFGPINGETGHRENIISI